MSAESSKNTTNVINISDSTININTPTLKRSYSSGSEASDSEVKRRTKKVTYFGKEGGEGAEEGRKIWNPLTKLVISNFDVTLFLKRFRNKNIKVAEVKNSLSDMRVLSLSHIFPINKYEEDFCVTKYLYNDKEKEDLLSFAEKNVALAAKASNEAVICCKKISDYEDVVEWKVEGPLDTIVHKICLNYKNNNFIVQPNSEASFMEKFINPIIRIVFLENCDKNLIMSTIDGTDKSGSKPDIMLGFRYRKNETFVFFVEVKRPAMESKHQAESDFIKIMKQMKRSINTQVDKKINNPFSFGLLIQGFQCHLYRMTLVEDGIYLPVMVKKFKLVEDIEDVVNVPAIAEAMYYVKQGLVEYKEKYVNREKGDSYELANFTKPSFQTTFV